MSAVGQAAALFDTIRGVDFFGRGGQPMPPDADLDRVLREGAMLLPHAYEPAFVAPVRAGMPRLLALARQGRVRMSSVEIVAGSVYQHGADWLMGAELRRLVAVVSNLYRSFLDSARRRAAGMPDLGQVLPPLAAFSHDGTDGPMTLAVDLIAAYLQGRVGVVALPATLAAHPVLWMALVHETGGHDVTHADAGLLDELAAGLPAVLAPFAGQTGLSDEQHIMVWARWLDEAVADIYALLNAGPAFAENLVVMLAAMGGNATPMLRMDCGADGRRLLDAHPADILRLHVLLGAVAALEGLSGRVAAALRLCELADAFGRGDRIGLSGALPDGPQRIIPFAAQGRREPLARAAEAVGHYIATAPLRALGNLSIQRIETWDDEDVRAVDTIRDALAAGRPISRLGDDAQLLAAASDAVMADAAAYGTVTAELNAALDESFRTDPIWSFEEPDRMYFRNL